MSNLQGFIDKYMNDGAERFFHDVFGGEYAPVLNAKADVVLDVGATAGEFSAYIYNKASVIYALEPYSAHYEELTGNIKEFGLDKIKPFRMALSDYNGEGNFLTIGGRGGNRLINGDGDEYTEKVQVKTLATFMKDVGIDHINILKIDIENGEVKVFNSPDFKDIAYKIDFIIGEHIADMQSLFEGYGFKSRRYPENGVNIIYERI